MAFDVSALEDYSKQNSKDLARKAVTGSPTAALIKEKGNVRVDVKSEDSINQLDGDVVLQDGGSCGWSGAGTTVISQRKIKVGAVKVNEPLCVKTLEKKFTSQFLPQGGNYTETIFGQEITDDKIAKIQSKNEKLIWKGDTDLSGDANLKWCDGFIKLIDADTTVVIVNCRKGAGTISAATNSTALTGSGTSFTDELAVGDKIYAGSTLIGTISSVTNDTTAVLAANGASAASGLAFNIVPKAAPVENYTTPITAANAESNILDIIKYLYRGIPEEVLESTTDQVIIFGGTDDARRLKLAAMAANLFHFSPDEIKSSAPFVIPNIGLTFLPTPGLTGTGRLFAIQPGNMFLGTDMLDEQMMAELFYAKEADEMRFKAEYKIGVQYAFGSQIASYRRLA